MITTNRGPSVEVQPAPELEEHKAVLMWVIEIRNQKIPKEPWLAGRWQKNLCPKHEMIGENYPEKELLKNDLALTLCSSSMLVFVPLWLLASLKSVRWGSESGKAWDPKLRRDAYFLLLLWMAGVLGEVGDKRIILFILVCPNYLLGLPSISFPLKT